MAAFTTQEAQDLRELFMREKNPEDSDYLKINEKRPIAEFRYIARYQPPNLCDPNAPIHEVIASLNQAVCPPKARMIPPRIDTTSPVRHPEPILSAKSAAIPPKIRAKAIAKTPTVPTPPDAFAVRPPPSISPQGDGMRVPLLPRIATSPLVGGGAKPVNAQPGIGALAAVLHPQLGPAHVCRVLEKRSQNGTDYFLVAFFQAEHSPCFVPSEFLFTLESHGGFPLDEEGEFKRILEEQEVSVDWLLERIFSAGQVVAINNADILFPEAQVRESSVKPTPEQVQQTMFQCVTCASLLIVGYIAARWTLPEGKLRLIVDTILQTNPAKFASTQCLIEQIKRLLDGLFLPRVG
jgi:hypothetical protein